MSHKTVLILDYGSQYTQLITRRVRELGIYSVILPGDVSLERIRSFNPSAVILSGGPSSVYDDGAPTLPDGFLGVSKIRKASGSRHLLRHAASRARSGRLRRQSGGSRVWTDESSSQAGSKALYWHQRPAV